MNSIVKHPTVAIRLRLRRDRTQKPTPTEPRFIFCVEAVNSKGVVVHLRVSAPTESFAKDKVLRFGHYENVTVRNKESSTPNFRGAP